MQKYRWVEPEHGINPPKKPGLERFEEEKSEEEKMKEKWKEKYKEPKSE